MAITYYLFRHVKAPKNPALQRESDYGFRRPVSRLGIRQGMKLRRKLGRIGVKPIVVLHSESPRAIVTMHLACQGLGVRHYLPLKEFWPSDAGFFKAMWTMCLKHNFHMQGYLNDEFAMRIYKAYGEFVRNEIKETLRKKGIHHGDVLIFGHGVWNNFIAWALAGFPEDKEPFFPKLMECDGLVVNGRNVKHLPFSNRGRQQ